MSLRNSPRHTVRVQPRTKAPGVLGQNRWTAAGAPAVVSCNVHPLTAVERVDMGLQNTDSRKVYHYGISWPGDSHCSITVDGMAGEWDQTGPAVYYGIGSLSAHWEVVITRRGGGDGSGV